jgi:hypothetical protein
MGLLTAATSNSGGAVLFLVFLLFFYVLFALPVWGTYQKASPQGDPAWAAFVPVYNFIVLLRIAGRPKTWAWFLFLLIPVVPFGSLALLVISIFILNDVSKSFGHGPGFTVGLVLLPVIFWFILWLGKSTYLGPKGPTAMVGAYGGYPNQGYPPPGGYAQPGYPQQGYPQPGYPQPGGYPPPPPPAPGAGYPPPPPPPPPPAPGAGYPPPPQPGTAYPPPPTPPVTGMPPEAPPQPPAH